MPTKTLADYMAACNAHYYATRDPLGIDGDFITAPEISQIFGEAIGLWCANEWLNGGEPKKFTLLEMGGGRGTLMADALRAITQVLPAFLRSMTLQLLESSPLLRDKQLHQLSAYHPTFIDALDALPPYPLFVIANEFFDALPINQYRCVDGQWQIRGVSISPSPQPSPQGEGVASAQDKASQLFVKHSSAPSPWGEGWGEGATFVEIPINIANVPPHIQSLAPATWAEYSPDSITIMQTLAAHIAMHGGAMLVIDYGYSETAPGDTLQAVKKHRYADPLSHPGEIDLTAHVDFSALAQAAAPLRTSITTQGELLHALGGRERLATLCTNKDTTTQASLRAAYARLTEPEQMGDLFKAMMATR